MSVPTLYLVPAPLSQTLPAIDLGGDDLACVRTVRNWLVETPKQARAWLKLYEHPGPIADLRILSLGDVKDAAHLTQWLRESDGAVAVMSDAGCPGIADPGALAVAAAHSLGWTVQPMVGASSIVLALMGSGLSGQRFVFHGYLPTDAGQRLRCLKDSELQSARLDQCQIAIETPYRNAALLTALCENLRGDTRLCLATELRGPGQRIRTQTVSAWRQQLTTAADALGKQATLFLWQAAGRSAQAEGGARRRQQ